MKLTAAVSNLNYPCTDNIVHYRILRACAYNEQLKMKCNSQVSPKKDTNTVLFFLLGKQKRIFFSTSQDYFLYLLWSSLCSLVVFGWWWCKAIMNQHQPNALQTNLLKIKKRVSKNAHQKTVYNANDCKSIWCPSKAIFFMEMNSVRKLCNLKW